MIQTSIKLIVSLYYGDDESLDHCLAVFSTGMIDGDERAASSALSAPIWYGQVRPAPECGDAAHVLGPSTMEMNWGSM